MFSILGNGQINDCLFFVKLQNAAENGTIILKGKFLLAVTVPLLTGQFKKSKAITLRSPCLFAVSLSC